MAVNENSGEGLEAKGQSVVNDENIESEVVEINGQNADYLVAANEIAEQMKQG